MTSRRERRFAARERMLPPDRKCRHCGKVVIRSRAWILLPTWKSCKSCFMKRGKVEDEQS